jgi:hypothetical protein
MIQKRALSILIIAVCTVSVLSSCDWLNSLFGEPSADPFVGTWDITEESVDGTPLPIGTGPSDWNGTFMIKSDNTLTGEGSGGGTPYTGTGTWSKSGSDYIMVVTYTGNPTPVTITGSLSSDAKTYTGSSTSPVLAITLAKR